MNKTPEEVSFKFIIRRSSTEPLRLDSEVDRWIFAADYPHMAILRPTEVAGVAPEFVNSALGSGQLVGQLTIVCPLKGRAPVEAVLDAVRGREAGDADLQLMGARVSARLLTRILGEWDSVNLAGCALEKNWWRRAHGPRRCKMFRLSNCTAFPAPDLTTGCATWPELTNLCVDGAVWDPLLEFESAFPPSPLVRHDAGFPDGVSPFVRAFFGPSVENFNVPQASEISWLAGLPDSPNLQELWLSGSPMTEEVLGWIGRQRSIRFLALSWHPDVHLPWQHLARLRKLRGMSLTGTRFSDAELAELAAHTRLRTLHAYYAKLTPLSWPLVFSMSTLRQIWVSTEMLEGPIPPHLPATTDLREVVALNVGASHIAYLKELLKLYPLVTYAEM